MTDESKLNVGLVGLGTWAKACHLPCLTSTRFSSHAKLTALCSRSRERGEALAKSWGVSSVFTSVNDMLEGEQLDVVIVATADHVHTQPVLQALEAGCDVLVEKPLAMDLQECRSILEASTRSGKKVITLFHKRSDPLWSEARTRIQRNDFGPLQMGWASIQNPLTVPVSDYFSSDLADHTNSNWFLGTHFYDLIRYVTGLNPVSVRSSRYNDAGETLSGAAAFKADFRMENSASISVLTSWNLSPHYPSLTRQSMCLHFHRGDLDLDGTKRGFTQDGSKGYQYVNPYFMRETAGGPAGYAADFLEQAIVSLRTSVFPDLLPDAEDSWWASSMAAAVDESALLEKEVQVEPPPKDLLSKGGA